MDEETAIREYKNFLENDDDTSPAIAALHVLLKFLVEDDETETLQGLANNIHFIVDALMRVESTVISVRSASELFIRFITLTSLDHSDFKECKEVLSKRGATFIDRVCKARARIARIGKKFIAENTTILVHSHSRVVYQTLLEAHKAEINFHVYVTMSAPDYSGKLMYEKLKNAGIDCTLIIDAAVSHIMERVKIVLLGAAGVVESGGIINKIGTYGIAMCAKQMKKDVYVLAESVKFVRIFPLNQRDLVNELKRLKVDIGPPEQSLLDYTPPAYINLLFTDLGILTTSAVSDELIKLYM